MLRKQFPNAVPVMETTRDDVLTYSYGEDFVSRHLPQEHWRKLWSTNLLKRLNVAAPIRLVGTHLLELTAGDPTEQETAAIS
jgi:hypothetical protein